MYYNNDWLYNNLCAKDSNDFDIDPISGENCFIIANNIGDSFMIKKAVNKLFKTGYKYFNIFGEYANLWEEIIYSIAKDTKNINVEACDLDLMKLAYDLGVYISFKDESINYLISDDEYLTEYIIGDLDDILNDNTLFTPSDWKKFRDGFEFTCHDKDAIISIGEKLMIGFWEMKKCFLIQIRALILLYLMGKVLQKFR